MNVWIVIPAHGRAAVSRVAFAGIAWTLSELRKQQIDACGLVIADDENLNIATQAGLDTLERPNRPLGRKWNDGYEYAFAHGATHVVSCGSDDWIHPELILAMRDAQTGKEIAATRLSSAMSPDGRELALLHIPYEGGDGIRLLPESLLASVGYRPTLDKRDRAIDGAMRDNLSRHQAISWTYVETHPLHIVDFKSDSNLTAYEAFAPAGYVTGTAVPDALRDHYPARLVEMAENLYAQATA
jgi:glycosyltransferase involved in cell wall biosynthesis